MASLKKRPGNPVYYIQFYVGTRQRRISTDTDSFQLAKEKLRQFESAQARGDSAFRCQSTETTSIPLTSSDSAAPCSTQLPTC